MNEFVRRHEGRIQGVLSCFDRMLLRGYLPIMSGWSMAQFLRGQGVGNAGLKPFLLENAERVKAHAVALAKKHERPFQYLTTSMRKEDAARKLAERNGIEQGLVCVFSVLEPCRTFSFRFTTHSVDDMARAQRFADRFANLKWPAILNRYARRVTPQLQSSLPGCQHHWVSAQSESTDTPIQDLPGPV